MKRLATAKIFTIIMALVVMVIGAHQTGMAITAMLVVLSILSLEDDTNAKP